MLFYKTVFNVKLFGAKGDGTTDDTAAIQGAINAALLGGTVLFPPGIYKVISTLSVNPITTAVNGVNFLFQPGAILMPNLSSNTVLFINNINNTDGTVTRITIKGMRLDGINTTNSIGVLIDSGANIHDSGRVYFDDVEIRNFGGGSGYDISGTGPSYHRTATGPFNLIPQIIQAKGGVAITLIARTGAGADTADFVGIIKQIA